MGINSAPSCFDDKRVELIRETAVDAFFQRLTYDESKTEFDVIIVDAQDPQANEVFVDSLPWDRNFIRNLYSMLADDGIIIMQLGKAPNSDYSSEMVDNVLLWLEDVG